MDQTGDITFFDAGFLGLPGSIRHKLCVQRRKGSRARWVLLGIFNDLFKRIGRMFFGPDLRDPAFESNCHTAGSHTSFLSVRHRAAGSGRPRGPVLR